MQSHVKRSDGQIETAIKAIRTNFNSSPNDTFLRVHCLHGIGGVGKTQISLAYANATVSEGKTVFWLHGEQEASLLHDVDEITRRLFPQYETADKTIRKPRSQDLFQQWLLENRSWLIVFDNVDQIRIIKQYWPTSKHGCVLVTSRDPDVVTMQMGDRVEKTKVLPFSDQEGANFLHGRMESKRTDERAAAIELSGLLGGLPIALAHAASYLERCTIQDLLDLPGMRNMSFKFLDNHVRDAANFDYELGFATIFKPSLDDLYRNKKEASQALNFLALLNQDSIEEALIKQPHNLSDETSSWRAPGLYTQAINDLRSLVDQDYEKGTLSFHRLVRWAVIREWTTEQWQENFRETFRFLDPLFPKQVKGRSLVVGDNLTRCRRVAAHIQSLEKGYREGKDHLTDLMGFANLLANCGFYMYERGLNTAAFNILQSAREICRTERGEDPDLTHALVLNNLAVIHGIRNEPQKALELDIQVVAWRELLLGPDDVELGNSFNNLASKYYDLGDLANARLFYKKSVRIYKTAKDAHEEIFGLVLANLGRVHTALAEYEKAEKRILRALEIQRRVLGTHYFTAATLYKLANLRVCQGKVESARTLTNESLDMRKRLLGDKDSRVGVAYHKRASISRKLGELENALSDIREAIRVFIASADNCERGLLVRSWFLQSFILHDILLVSPSHGLKLQALNIRIKALDAREKLGVPKSTPCENEGDIDTLVQPDYR